MDRDDMSAFEQTDDSVLSRIKFLADLPTAGDGVRKAAKILDDISRRKLYPLVGQACRTHERNAKIESEKNGAVAGPINDKTLKLLKNQTILVENICSVWPEIAGETRVVVTEDQLKLNLIASVRVSDIHQGQKNEDPLDLCVFYAKENPSVAITFPVEADRNKFRVFYVRLYCRCFDDSIITASKLCFKKWYQKNRFNTFVESAAASFIL